MKDDKHLTLAQTTKLAGTIDTVELTGIQLAMLCNALGLSLNKPELLPQDLRENVHYMNGCQDLLVFMQSHIDGIIGKKGA